MNSLLQGAGSRPLAGYLFDDYHLGQRFRHAIPRTVGAGEASLYIALTGERHPLHCCAPLARALGYRAVPLDDLLVFNIAFGQTVADISSNAIANLGYADMRFLAPVYAGDTLACESEVIGVKRNSSGKSGVVYVRSRASNQEGTEVLSWARWVMLPARSGAAATNVSPQLPNLPAEVDAANFVVAAFLTPAALTAHFTGSARTWEDYAPGTVIDHPSGMTLEESDHMLATRLYQNSARVHFDAFAARDGAFGKRLIYGGHVMSVCRALSYDGLENAFALAAVHGGTHSNPTFAGDTLYCRHVVLGRSAIAARADLGALRLRMLGAKNIALADLPALAVGERHPAVVLDLDYSVLIPRRQNA
ncbi:MAG TPA: MaoC family dehydratase [Usitatibacter sp.]|nr:MaoC family dehydratase [Usitatibacter sp.]